MRRVLLVLSVLFITCPALAQKPDPALVYLPLVYGGELMTEAWRLIVPEATTNYVLNPSGEIAGNYAAGGGAVVTRSTTYAKYGLYSYNVVTGTDGDALELTLTALTNAAHFVTLRVRGQPPAAWALALGPNFRTPIQLEQLDTYWTLWGAAFPAAEASGSTTLYVLQRGAGAGDFYVDGVQVEPKADYWTSYTDGTQEGCKWNGDAHAATSERGARTRAGGRVLDLSYYGFIAEAHAGTGAADAELTVQTYSQLPGGVVSAARTKPRTFSITGTLTADNERQLYARREALALALSPTAYDGQPVRLRFAAAATQKQIAANYESGLEGDYEVFEGPYVRNTRSGEWEEKTGVYMQGVALRFLAGDPFFREVGESAAALDTNDSGAFKIVTARFRDTGQWDSLGPPAAGGTYNNVRAFAEDANYIYVGGDFTNFDADANADYVVRYDKVAGTWGPMSSGTDGVVHALLLAPDGHLFAAGEFSNAGGGAAAHVAEWDPGAGAWSALGAGVNANAYSLAIDSDGDLYVGGSFTTAGGGAASRIAKWDGAAWSALGAGLGATCWAIAIQADDTLIAGGAFTTGTGAAGNYTVTWNGTAWAAFSDELDATVYALALTRGGQLYAGGAFTDHVSFWNGTFWATLDGGVNGDVWDLFIAPDDTLFIAGAFSTAGGIALNDRVTRWGGSSFAHLDLNLPGAVTCYAVMATDPDPVKDSLYTVWLGFNTDAGTTYYDGIVTVENEGTIDARPAIVFTRAGGTSATIETVKNELTGVELLFNYGLRDGETLTVVTTPAQMGIVSDYGLFPQRPKWEAMLVDSALTQFTLPPGESDVSSFVDVAGAPTITAYMLWQDTYESLD